MTSRTLAHTASGTLIETTSKPMLLQRPQNWIARDGIDYACLVVALAGSGVINQVNRPEDILRPGDLILYDLNRPYTAAIEPSRALRLCVPRDLFAMRVGRIEILSGFQLRGGSGFVDLFTNYLVTYVATLPTLSTHEAEIGMEGVLHLLSGLVKTTLLEGACDGGGALKRNTLCALAMRHIEALLANPQLDVAMLARETNVTRSRLYEAFVPQGGIASAIQDARLDRARHYFSASEYRHHTLEEIALLCGFIEYATFTKAFRRRFGVSPNTRARRTPSLKP